MEDLLFIVGISVSFILGYIFGRLDQENKNKHEKRYRYR